MKRLQEWGLFCKKTQMKKNIIPEVLGVVISVSGALVMADWVLNIGILKKINPAWVTMVFSTAFSFVFSGIVLYFSAQVQRKNHELAVLIIPIASMVVLLLMATLLASSIIGISMGIEDMVVRDPQPADGGYTPGQPSITTMLNFILIATAGALTTMNVGASGKVMASLGAIVGIVGLTAIVGYISHQPMLSLSVPGSSNAMALHTAILFVLWGVGAIFIKRNR